MKTKVLVVEDDTSLRNVLIDSISFEGHQVEGVDSAEEAIKRFEKENYDVVLTDVNLPGKSGLDLLLVCRQHNPEVYMLVMTGYGTIDIAVKAMKYGAEDFLCKPISLNDLSSAIRVADQKLSNQTQKKSSSKNKESQIIAKSGLMNNLLDQIETIAPYNINVLITGETGTGKELVAREIHNLSGRKKKDYIALNCAAVPENLLEDELFGHVKGAYTGAQTERKGRFEQADGGTLFLDEIGDMNHSLQTKLLRILQEREFERLGSAQTIKVDVRVVAATSANLNEKIADGSFRPDLYHRLNVVHLNVPPLRDRPDDILPIAKGLLDRFCEVSGLPEKTISEETHHTLISYNFPGNVRQLQNCMERAAVFSGEEDEIKIKHLPEEIKNQSNMFQMPVSNSAIPTSIPDEGIDLSKVVTQVERDLLLQTLKKTGGNKMQAAKLLNMKRTTLVEKIKRLELDEDDEDDGNLKSAVG